jgi:ribosomal protein L29
MAAKKELMLMGVKKAARQEVPTYSFKALKHKIAQLKTVRREREIEKGVGLREARGLDYVMRRDNTFW